MAKFEGYSRVGQNQNENHSIKCGSCGNDVGALEVAHYVTSANDWIYWVICPVCSYGSVIEMDGSIHPSVKYGVALEGLSKEVNDAYEEARSCYSIGSLTGCQLICRKILMHIAVDKCGGEEGKSFAEYIDKIKEAGYITPPMKGWVDKIREEGNDATHKLEPPSREDTEHIINFTIQLLRLVYEMEYKANKFTQSTE